MRTRLSMLLVLAVVAVLLVGATGLVSAAEGFTFYYIDHGTSGNPFWTVYYQGIEDAAKMLAPYGVQVKHLSAEADVRKQIEMLEMAIATNPDGIVTSMIDPESFDPILRPAIERGIPVMAVNVEDPREDRIPYLTYYGEDTWAGGTALAEAVIRYIEETNGFEPKHILLCNPMAGHMVWETRLNTFGEAMTTKYGSKTTKVVVGEDPTKAMEIIRANLVRYPDIDVIVAPVHFTHANVDLVRTVGKEAGKDIYLAAFDLMPETLQDIKDGKVVATADQQQYLQGFSPLIDLYLYKAKYGLYPSGPVSTGPSIVDRHNVDTVIEGSRAGYR
jgi:simple sugar transport system substrate-binding protein